MTDLAGTGPDARQPEVPMLIQLLAAAGLLAFCVIVHGAVLSLVIPRLERRAARLEAGFWPGTNLLITVALWALVAHLIEIAAWATFYAWQHVMPDTESAIYFSAITYATVGYGDLLPPREWWLLASVEGLTGILMCGWSTGFFFAVVNRINTSPQVGEPS